MSKGSGKKMVKVMGHLLFAVLLVLCFAAPAVAHWQEGHALLSVCLWGNRAFYVAQAVGRFRAAWRAM